MSDSSSTTKLSFVSLPAEIRLRIYDFALPQEVFIAPCDAYVIIHTRQICGPGHQYLFSADQRHPLSLLSTTKLTRREAMPLLQARIVLYLSHGLMPRHGGLSHKHHELLKLPDVTGLRHVEMHWSLTAPGDLDLRQFQQLKTLKIWAVQHGLGGPPYWERVAGTWLTRRAKGLSLDLDGVLRHLGRRYFGSFWDGELQSPGYADFVRRCRVIIKLPDERIRIHLGTYTIKSDLDPRYDCKHDVVHTGLSKVQAAPWSKLEEYALDVEDDHIRAVIDGTIGGYSLGGVRSHIMTVLVYKELLGNQSHLLPEELRRSGGGKKEEVEQEGQ